MITLTDKAIEALKQRMVTSAEPVMGIRIKVTNTGCSGHSYAMDFVYDGDVPKEPETTVDVEEGLKLHIPFSSEMYLLGTEMDFVEEDLASRFVFNNPNATDHCGCGESFKIN